MVFNIFLGRQKKTKHRGEQTQVSCVDATRRYSHTGLILLLVSSTSTPIPAPPVGRGIRPSACSFIAVVWFWSCRLTVARKTPQARALPCFSKTEEGPASHATGKQTRGLMRHHRRRSALLFLFLQPSRGDFVDDRRTHRYHETKPPVEFRTNRLFCVCCRARKERPASAYRTPPAAKTRSTTVTRCAQKEGNPVKKYFRRRDSLSLPPLSLWLEAKGAGSKSPKREERPTA